MKSRRCCGTGLKERTVSDLLIIHINTIIIMSGSCVDVNYHPAHPTELYFSCVCQCAYRIFLKLLS